jgi:uncharacterized protein YdhG (YjbR/CyaY superfamily)
LTKIGKAMMDNKTKPTAASVDGFIASASDKRRQEANRLIKIMAKISGDKPVMWGPSIIGFGLKDYKYETGRTGTMPRLSFSPRKAAITIYFAEGFDRYGEQLAKLGKYKASMSCLYINKLEEIELPILKQMLELSYRADSDPARKPKTVKEYITRIPEAARSQFDELREVVVGQLPEANEVISYGILGYKIDDKRARVFISGWKDHTAMYPIPKDKDLTDDLKPYIKGKGTLWFPLDKPLPKGLIKRAVKALVKN